MKDNDAQTPATRNRQSSALAEHTGWNPFWSLRSEIDDLFEDFFRAGWGGRTPSRQQSRAMGSGPPIMVPTLDVIEKENEVKLVADMPGLCEDDIEVQVADRVLTISGEKKEEVEDGDEDGERHISERRFGRFARRLTFPDGIDQDNIDASFRNGVLIVRLPKSAEAQPQTRKIEVKRSD